MLLKTTKVGTTTILYSFAHLESVVISTLSVLQSVSLGNQATAFALLKLALNSTTCNPLGKSCEHAIVDKNSENIQNNFFLMKII